MLRKLVMNQYVEVRWEQKGDQSENEPQALVYWVKSGKKIRGVTFREGLDPVPFESRTLINAYLAASKYYKLADELLKSPDLRKELISETRRLKKQKK